MAVRRRRAMPSDTTDYWRTEVQKCLTTNLSKGSRWGWGCLNKHGSLFRINSLNTVQVPINVISKMETEGVLTLKDNGYFSYTPVIRRSALFNKNK